MKNLKEPGKVTVTDFLLLALAGTVNAFGVTVFLYPLRLYDSGVSGLSMLLDQITPAYLTLPIFLIIINVPIFIFGLKKQGVNFTISSVFAISIYSVMSFLFMKVFKIDVEFVSPLAGEDLLLCAIFGGAISGIGSGLTIRYGGAIDGIDVLAVMYSKRLGISIGTFNMIFNAVLYIVCGFAVKSWILPLYSVVTYFIGSKTTDFVVEGFDRSKCAMIVTEHAVEISGGLQNYFKDSGTIINGVGGYSRKEKDIVYFIVNSFQIYKVKQIVFDIDPNAFISLHDVSDVIKDNKFQ